MLGIERLQEAYLAAFPGYSKGITVPAIVDIATVQVVTNDFARLTLDLSTEWVDHHRDGAPDLYPQDRARRDRRGDGVGVPGRQQRRLPVRVRRVTGGLRAGVPPIVRRLDRLTARLERQRYLVGDTITEADVRLFTTLVRFDAVYHGHFKCNRSKLSEMPVLWAYARDLFQTPGFGDTIDFEHIKHHYYEVHRDINPTGIVPAGPDLAGWSTPHRRDELGGRPFGDGTPPPPPAADETVPTGHGARVA